MPARTLLALLLTGCGVGFVDPSPAELARVPRSWTSTPRAEPVVFGVAFDLQVASPELCASAKASLHAAVASVFLPAGTDGTELSFQDLAPGCQQTGNERIDVATWESEVASFARAHPGAAIRPVFVFADNLPGSPPYDLRNDLLALETWYPNGTLAGELWGLTHPDLAPGQVSFAIVIPWTDAGDPTLPAAIAREAAVRLPFESQDALAQEPLLDPATAAGIQAFKVCSAPSNAGLGASVLRGETQPVDPNQPPAIQLQFPEAIAVPKDALHPLTESVVLETCTKNCARSAIDARDQRWRQWDVTAGCFLAEGSR